MQIKTNSLILFLILLIALFDAKGQNAKYYFRVVDSILSNENSSKNLITKLDTLKSSYIPSRSSFSVQFSRDVDFNFKHQRLKLELNHSRFQIDLLTKNDSICVKALRTYHNPFEINESTIDSANSFISNKVEEYLIQRNKYYKGNKKVNDLLKEISEYRVFAFYCGAGLSMTDEGRDIKNIVYEEESNKLLMMLQSICIETQAYGVSGFKMLENNGYPIPSYVSKIVNHIKKRNSETVICSGCLYGIIDKIYSRK